MLTPDVAAVVLRVTVGTIFIAQGYRKLLGPPDVPFGRANLTTLIASKNLPRPALIAMLTAAVELLGGALVLVGLGTRLAVAPLAIIVAFAAAVFKRDAGFFGGWDWPFSVLGASLAILLLGGGAYSVDAVFAR